jgi:hypothetical protein
LRIAELLLQERQVGRMDTGHVRLVDKQLALQARAVTIGTAKQRGQSLAGGNLLERPGGAYGFRRR